MKRLIAGMVLAVSVAVLTGCETMGGAGKDMQHAGQSITNAANK